MNKAHLLLLATARNKDLARGAQWMANLVYHADGLTGPRASIMATSLELYGAYVSSDDDDYLEDADVFLGSALREELTLSASAVRSVRE